MPASDPDIYIRGGLCAPKHVAAMGEAVWLYFHLHKRVRFDGENAGETMDGHPYRHPDAAAALGVSVATVKRWFARLEAAGYVTSRRLPYGLVVRITKYERASSRAARRQMRSSTSEPSLRDAERSVESEPSRSVNSDLEIAHFCTPEVADVSARSVNSEPSLYKDARGTKGSKETNDSKAGGADAPPPAKPRGNPKVAALVDALRAEGMSGRITPRDAKAVKDIEHDPAEVAAMYAAIFNGEHGDEFMQINLSVALCLERLPGWLSKRAGHAPQAKPAAVASRRATGQDYLAWRREQVRAEQAAGEANGQEAGLRRLPGGATDADYHALPAERAR